MSQKNVPRVTDGYFFNVPFKKIIEQLGSMKSLTVLFVGISDPVKIYFSFHSMTLPALLRPLRTKHSTFFVLC